MTRFAPLINVALLLLSVWTGYGSLDPNALHGTNPDKYLSLSLLLVMPFFAFGAVSIFGAKHSALNRPSGHQRHRLLDVHGIPLHVHRAHHRADYRLCISSRADHQGLTKPCQRTATALYVRAEGTVYNAKILKSTGHDILDQEALQTFKTWQFLPEKAPFTVKVPCDFKYRGK